MRGYDHKETKAILKMWFIYIPLAFGGYILSNTKDYFREIKIKIFRRKNNQSN